jgi:hypothetical protein
MGGGARRAATDAAPKTTVNRRPIQSAVFPAAKEATSVWICEFADFIDLSMNLLICDVFRSVNL